MSDDTPRTPSEHEPAATASGSLPTEPAHAAPAPAQPAAPFWRRTATRVTAGVAAAVVLLLVGFSSGWLVRGELHRPFGVTAPAQGWGHDRGGMPGGGMPGMRDHDDDDDQSAPDEQSMPDQPAPGGTTDSSPSS